ncbi:MAG: nitroreductase family deazaflavin-dependent oxidoreductase [Chloroflexota bacterium]|nr:nitroreductase family deazaflavin-dependent oxidoreductase [Chloroflexota bacterium]MDE2941404.1 nitroreductase family deazaflavin-dependent oxidoreductase [Chloroflexota bacterium]MDE3268592.1 nitroreductase family deazaflavin-dependent oxidoreductase [Chloroflexota bacterium]
MTTSENRPRGWVDDHIRRYLESNGEDGHIWNGVPTLLLTTTGRKSGRSYTTPLIYGRFGDSYVIVASKGGAPKHPDWYMNLSENPEVGVQVAADKFTARARTAGPDEKPEVWATMAEIWPEYDLYQTRTSRVIPVVILERLS